MRNLTLENITNACRGNYRGDSSSLTAEVSGVVIDNRKVEKGCLFVAIDGTNVNAHQFIPDAVDRGAMCVVSHEDLGETDYPYILVESTGQALLDIAKLYRDSFNIKVVGITGSVGKTSTKEMIASVLKEKYKVHKTAGNFNNEIGLPLTLLRIRKEHQAAVVEMGISDFGEMHRLAKMARPDICVITNIGICHLENLKSRDGILKAKSEIFDYLKPEGHIVLNGEDEKLATIQKVKGVQPVFYGSGREIYADQIQNQGLEGVSAVIHTPKGCIKVNIPIPGEHNVSNAMAAAAVGLSLDMELLYIQAGIEQVKAIGGRSNLMQCGSLQILDDCYNANPVSMRASLDVLSSGTGRTVAVLGDMGELGEDEEQLHYVAQKKIDALFCAGSLSAQLAQGARDGGMEQVFYFAKRQELIEHLLEFLKEGDTVLVKASHFMEYPKVVEALKAREQIGQS